MPITERSMVTDRGAMSWLEAGAGWPVILLHAFPLEAGMWRPQLEVVPQGWRFTVRGVRVGQRSTGIALCVLAGALALTGYLLYYFAPDSVRPGLGWLHSGLGATMAGLVVVHRRKA